LIRWVKKKKQPRKKVVRGNNFITRVGERKEGDLPSFAGRNT